MPSKEQNIRSIRKRERNMTERMKEKEFENKIESVKILAGKNCSESYISLVDLAEIINNLCDEYGKERVMNALRRK